MKACTALLLTLLIPAATLADIRDQFGTRTIACAEAIQTAIARQRQTSLL